MTLPPRLVVTSSSHRISWPEPSAAWLCFTHFPATRKSPPSLTQIRGLLTSGKQRAACMWGWHCWQWSLGGVECCLQQWLAQSYCNLMSFIIQAVCVCHDWWKGPFPECFHNLSWDHIWGEKWVIKMSWNCDNCFPVYDEHLLWEVMESVLSRQ